MIKKTKLNENKCPNKASKEMKIFAVVFAFYGNFWTFIQTDALSKNIE